MFIISRRSSNLFRLGTCLRKKFSSTVVRCALLKTAKPTSNHLCHNKFCTAAPDDGFNYDAITNGDKDLEHKLRVLILEVEVMRQEGRLVPDPEFMKESHWKELLNNRPTISSRGKYLEFLFKLSKKIENRAAKKEQKRLDWEQNRPEKKKEETFEEFASTYDLSHNNIFLRFYDSTINQYYNNRLVQAMQFGQKLVVDCGYDEQMVSRESKNCAKQLMLLFAENRSHDEPFDLHYCNANPDTVVMKTLHGHIATMYEPWFPLNVHEASYLDMFPKDQLVYLTPHCREEMEEFDHDAIYIIGAIVDKCNQQPLSLAKAKKEGLRMAQLPLDRYLQWGSGSGKSLTLNQVASILLDVKTTGDWKYALRHVPRRKILDQGEMREMLATSRPGQRRGWTPSAKPNFGGNLTYNNRDRNDRQNRDVRRFKVKSIMNDE